MLKQNIQSPKSAQQGVVIIEALIAILIFSIGVLGIVGMQANMVKNTAESKYRADAGYIAQQQIGNLWADPTLLPAEGVTITPDISSQLPGGTLTITRGTAAANTANLFTVTVTWQQPGEELHNFTTTASIAGS
ncbi:MAG TPA: prepilin-type cleavage/methylation domain-containing protein [Sideroxyarcus sp.]|nr:prepilin-type cleavage/methylation domain-containing protein [Sideroxyarcus sp.]